MSAANNQSNRNTHVIAGMMRSDFGSLGERLDHAREQTKHGSALDVFVEFRCAEERTGLVVPIFFEIKLLDFLLDVCDVPASMARNQKVMNIALSSFHNAMPRCAGQIINPYLSAELFWGDVGASFKHKRCDSNIGESVFYGDLKANAQQRIATKNLAASILSEAVMAGMAVICEQLDVSGELREQITAAWTKLVGLGVMAAPTRSLAGQAAAIAKNQAKRVRPVEPELSS